jgi:hypothetical protein
MQWISVYRTRCGSSCKLVGTGIGLDDREYNTLRLKSVSLLRDGKRRCHPAVPYHFPCVPEICPRSPSWSSSSTSSTGTKNSNASEQPRLSIPDIKINVVGPEEDDPHPMQEFYPPPSPIAPSPAGGPSNEAMINRLDGVSSQIVWSGLALMPSLGSGTRIRRRTGTRESVEQLVQIMLPSPERPGIGQNRGLLQ